MHGRMAARQTTEQPAELMRRSLIHCTQQLDREGPPANDPTEPNFREDLEDLQSIHGSSNVLLPNADASERMHE